MKTHLSSSYLVLLSRVWAPGWCHLYLVLLLMGGTPLVTSAQTTIWDKTFGGSAVDDLTEMVLAPDGGYLLGGTSTSGSSSDKSQANKGSTDFWVVKTDNQGNKLWDKSFGGSGDDNLRALIATPDGGYLVGGYSNSGISGDKTQATRGAGDYWVVKIDGSGNKQWDRRFGGSANDNLTVLLASSDGGYLLGGESNSGISSDKNQANRGGNDYWLVKINASGARLWDRTFGGSNNDNLAALITATNGDYLLGGTSASNISGEKSQNTRAREDYWVVRVNAGGTKVWDRTFGGILDTYENGGCDPSTGEDCNYYFGSSLLSALVTTPDGGFLLGGSSNAEQGAEKSEGNLSSDPEGYDVTLREYWVVKIDGQGNKVWDKTYGGIRKEHDDGESWFFFTGSSILSAIVPASDGNYLLAGSSDSDMGGDKSENSWRENEFSRLRNDYWVVKIDESGNKIWDETIGGLNTDYPAAILPAAGHQYVIAGTSKSDVGGDKTEASRDGLAPDYARGDYWLVKIKDETPVPATWNKRFGGTGNDAFSVVIKTADGGYLSGGYTNSGANGDKTQSSRGLNDFWIVKSNAAGNKVWDKRFGGSQDDYLNTVIQTADGGYLLGGSSLSGVGGDKTQAGRGSRDFWVVKISGTGVKQWDKRFGGSGSDELKKALQLSTGEYVLAGISNSPAGGDKSQGSQGGQDYWLLKISGGGTKIWDKRYGGSLNENLEGLSFTQNGGYLLGGSSLSGIGGDKTQSSRGSSDYWIVRVNNSGSKIWDKRFGGTGEDNLMDLGSTGTSTGNFFLAGHSTSGANGDRSQGSQGGKDFWMIKINGNGEELFDKRFGGNGDEGLRTILLTADGGYLLAGRSESGVSGDKTQTSRGSSDYWMVKTSSTGVKQWDKRFGGSGYDEIRTAAQTADGGFILGGRSDSGASGDRTQPSQGSYDYWLVKVAPEAIIATLATARVTTEEESKTPAPQVNVNAYPNPFTDQVAVTFTLPETQNAQLKIYDSQGREIATLFRGEAKAKQAYQVEWKAGNKANGMYFLQLQTPTNRQQHKLLLAK